MKLSRAGLDLSIKLLSPPPDEVVIVFDRPLFNWGKICYFFSSKKLVWAKKGAKNIEV